MQFMKSNLDGSNPTEIKLMFNCDIINDMPR